MHAQERSFVDAAESLVDVCFFVFSKSSLLPCPPAGSEFFPPASVTVLLFVWLPFIAGNLVAETKQCRALPGESGVRSKCSSEVMSVTSPILYFFGFRSRRRGWGAGVLSHISGLLSDDLVLLKAFGATPTVWC